MKATVISPRQVKPFWLVQDLITPLISAQQTCGKYELAHCVVHPGGGPPPHVHHREDEMFYVVDGEFAFVFDKQIIQGGPGTCVFLPRDIVHTFKNVGQTRGTLLVALAPGGFAEFGRAAARPCTDPNGPPPPIDPELLGSLAATAPKFGIELKPEWQATQPAPPRPTGKDYWVLGQLVRVVAGSADTKGTFSVAEISSAPGEFVPRHLHRREDEMFYVIEGTYEFDLDDGPVAAPAGTFVHVPKGVMHGFANRSNLPARLVDYHTPGGFEKFFAAAGTDCVDVGLGPPRGTVDKAWLMDVFAQHGMEVAAR